MSLENEAKKISDKLLQQAGLRPHKAVAEPTAPPKLCFVNYKGTLRNGIVLGDAMKKGCLNVFLLNPPELTAVPVAEVRIIG